MHEKEHFDIKIASPCPAKWEDMTGDERIRLCHSCTRHVYNISEMTRDEAEKLLTDSEEQVCGVIYRRADGTIITKDCPLALRRVRERLDFYWTAFVSCIIGLVGFMWAKQALQQALSQSFSVVVHQQAGALNKYTPPHTEVHYRQESDATSDK